MTDPRSLPPGDERSPWSRPTLGRAGYEAVPLVVVLVMAIVMVALEGGYADSPLYLATLFMLAVVGVTATARPLWQSLMRSRPLMLASGALAAFTVWAYLSIAWSDVRAESLRGADRTLLYALVFLVIACAPVTVRVTVPILLGFAVSIAVLVGLTAFRLSVSAHPLSFVIGNRLSAPIGYPNGTAALLISSGWLCFGLATRRWLGATVRLVAFGATTALVLLALLSQSRGSVFTTPLVIVVFLILVPGRGRALVGAAVLAAVAAVAAPHVLEVFRSEAPSELGDRVGEAVRVVGVASLVTCVAAACLVQVESRVTISPRAARIGTTAALLAIAAACLVAVIRVHPVERTGDWWHEFRTSTEVESTTTHFGGLGSNRYDFWRVGLGEFAAHPIQGIGVDSFRVAYLRDRRSTEAPLYPHSLVVDLLSQTGIVGSGLFLLFLVGAAWAVVERGPGPDRELAGVLAVAALAVVAHSTVDWLWEIPALGVITMVLVGLLFAVRPADDVSIPGPSRHRWPRASRVAMIGVGVVCIAAVLGPWLADRYTSHAAAIWQSSRSRSFSELDVARVLNPVSDAPDMIAATIAVRVGDDRAAQSRLEAAIRRNPSNWYAHLQLSAVASQLGEQSLATRSLRRAVDLNPFEPVVCLSVHRTNNGRPLLPLELQQALSRTPTDVGCDARNVVG